MAVNVNLNITVEAWADIVIKNWRQKIVEMDIGSTGQLFDSFAHEIISNSGGKPERVEFAFKYYGKFVDMGVGKYISLGSNIQTKRKSKKWYSPVLYSEVLKLREILGKKYSILGAGVIAENIREGEKESTSKKAPGKSIQKDKSELTEMDRAWMKRYGLL
ncbi:MAG: hypothetical protein H8D45_22785 [Bacteroidetes bacterium]|nr:hypothetical protein [Bacteroidota bacterium]MBL7105757.1 hypothetical protein [Bacteroidales bacterium]